MRRTKSSPRLGAEQRREAILRAALAVFAKSGFHGTTTKSVARAAGVSEALIFRHFPDKDHLYAALQQTCCPRNLASPASSKSDPSPSTATLVALVEGMMTKMLRRPEPNDPLEHQLHRMLAHSFLEDGEFARQFLRKVAEDWVQPVAACLRAAERAGDLTPNPIRPDLRAWFVQHFAAMLMLNQMPGEPIVDFGISAPRQHEQATWFALLGIGLKPAAIRRYYSGADRPRSRSGSRS